MAWRMPAESAPHARTWMVFPCEGPTLGSSDAERAAGYRAWVSVALAVAEFEPVTMVADPSETARARDLLGGDFELLEAPVDEFWARDVGPTFVVDAGGTVRWSVHNAMPDARDVDELEGVLESLTGPAR